MSAPDSRILVAVGTGLNPGDAPTVILGVTKGVWADLADGKAQDIDLRSLGIPAVLLIMRGDDHADITRQLSEAAGALDIPSRPLADLSVPAPKKH